PDGKCARCCGETSGQAPGVMLHGDSSLSEPVTPPAVACLGHLTASGDGIPLCAQKAMPLNKKIPTRWSSSSAPLRATLADARGRRPGPGAAARDVRSAPGSSDDATSSGQRAVARAAARTTSVTASGRDTETACDASTSTVVAP